MKTICTTLFAGVAALAFGMAAQAQTQPQPHPQAAAQQGEHRHWQDATPEQRAQFAAKHAEMRAKRAQKLHDQLGITAGQESAWKAFVASMEPSPHAQQDRAAWAALSAPERMAKSIEHQKQRTAELQARQGALNSFYSVLSADQKKVFDTQTAQMAAHRHERGEHGGHGRRAAQG
jgi:protein CpxP